MSLNNVSHNKRLLSSLFFSPLKIHTKKKKNLEMEFYEKKKKNKHSCFSYERKKMTEIHKNVGVAGGAKGRFET